jgi:hypothetical protein
MIYALAAVIAVETLLIAFLGYYAIKFARILLEVQDSIENSLDILDQRYASISKVLQIPLFYDSPEVRRVYDDVKASRDSILYVANLISKIEDVEEASER